ncbi:hypothetical protein FB567DRAFT_538510 [Paraphoma chrysanthemicola]|uniref:Secreted protein n=1 Tax=Paraphoma chrysanthemicola TaxID=798071 RepID=A0A8K0VSP9_9PLEO|nr:hypothetical protein FB567DRAFT_538510 [Paraphoma chrysanthemicola]
MQIQGFLPNRIIARCLLLQLVFSSLANLLHPCHDNLLESSTAASHPRIPGRSHNSTRVQLHTLLPPHISNMTHHRYLTIPIPNNNKMNFRLFNLLITPPSHTIHKLSHIQT